ncbi:MAG: hypothetical protein IKW83_03455 [Muribaculaceae bacterium]|nr:hypothetical protein [Muribaculaceae bacterium]
MRRSIIISILISIALAPIAIAGDDNKINQEWQRCVLAAVDSFPQNGGYYTGAKPNDTFKKTAWKGLHQAYQMTLADPWPVIDLQQAQPSFCSSATYLALVKALLMWDKDHKISREAWLAMKPFVGIVDNMNPQGYYQSDGEGFWGRMNGNGPAVAVTIHELKAGYNFTAYRGAKTDACKEEPNERYLTDDEWRNLPIWQQAKPGDFMKIFWNRDDDSGAKIGDNGNKGDLQEHGHSVIFMGIDSEGYVTYWSSNGPGENPAEMGYGMGRCDKTKIQRVVFTRITNPEKFDNAKKIVPKNVNQYIYDLNGKKHSTTKELKKHCGIK